MLGSIVEEALCNVGEHRFKFPGSSIQSTVLFCIALWLKANNATSATSYVYATRLAAFDDDCALPEKIKSSTPAGIAVKGVRAVRGAETDECVKMRTRYDKVVSFSTKCLQEYATRPFVKSCNNNM